MPRAAPCCFCVSTLPDIYYSAAAAFATAYFAYAIFPIPPDYDMRRFAMMMLML